MLMGISTILIVTGTSGAGKSTLKKYFKKHFDHIYHVYDFDDVGVPENPDTQWRVETTKYWINLLDRDYKSGDSAILFGQIIPDEIKNVPRYMKFIYLEADWNTIKKRLQKRNRNSELIATYKGRSDYIKKSTLKHGGIIVSTEQSIKSSVQDILHIIFSNKKLFDSWNDEKKRLNIMLQTDLKSVFINHRDIWNVKLGCNIGTEQNGKTGFIRPMLVIKKIGSVFFCVPLTTKKKAGKFYYTLDHAIQTGKKSTVILSQGRTIDKRRFFKYLGQIPHKEFTTIKKLLQTLYL